MYDLTTYQKSKLEDFIDYLPKARVTYEEWNQLWELATLKINDHEDIVEALIDAVLNVVSGVIPDGTVTVEKFSEDALNELRDFTKLSNKPDAFPTTWNTVTGKPTTFPPTQPAPVVLVDGATVSWNVNTAPVAKVTIAAGRQIQITAMDDGTSGVLHVSGPFALSPIGTGIIKAQNWDLVDDTSSTHGVYCVWREGLNYFWNKMRYA